MGTKPGDETIKGAPDFARKKTDPEVPAVRKSNPALGALPGKKDNYLKPSDDSRALGDHMGGTTGTHKVMTGETAPEVSQGAWRERAFTPRATMGRDEM